MGGGELRRPEEPRVRDCALWVGAGGEDPSPWDEGQTLGQGVRPPQSFQPFLGAMQWGVSQGSRVGLVCVHRTGSQQGLRRQGVPTDVEQGAALRGLCRSRFCARSLGQLGVPGRVWAP